MKRSTMMLLLACTLSTAACGPRESGMQTTTDEDVGPVASADVPQAVGLDADVPQSIGSDALMRDGGDTTDRIVCMAGDGRVMVDDFGTTMDAEDGRFTYLSVTTDRYTVSRGDCTTIAAAPKPKDWKPVIPGYPDPLASFPPKAVEAVAVAPTSATKTPTVVPSP